MAEPASQNLTILLSDIKGFTAKTSQKSRSDILAMLERHKDLVLPVLESKGGRLIKTIGDAFLVVFTSPTDAVLAGVAVQDVLTIYNEGKTEAERIEVRIAINAGEVSLADNDIFGDPVNITARIESIAEAGEVFFTEAVYLAMNKREVPSSEIGLRQLKGIPEKIRVYKVVREQPVGGMAPDAPPARGFLGLLHPKAWGGAPAAMVPAEAVRAGFWPRLGALMIDLLLCWLLLSTFLPSGPSIHVAAQKPQAVGAKTGGLIEADEKGATLGGVVRLDEKGIHRVAEDSSARPPKKERASDEEDEEDSETLYDNGKGLKVSKAQAAKGPPFFTILWVLYGTFFLTYWGATPGKRVFRLRVAAAGEGQALDWRAAFTRTLFTVVSAFCLLGFIWALYDKEGRTWHDLVAGTRVLRFPA